MAAAARETGDMSLKQLSGPDRRHRADWLGHGGSRRPSSAVIDILRHRLLASTDYRPKVAYASLASGRMHPNGAPICVTSYTLEYSPPASYTLVYSPVGRPAVEDK